MPRIQPQVDREIEDKALFLIQKARIHLLRNNPFYANLVVYLKPVPDWNLSTPTMATDGKCLYYYPPFVVNTDFKVILAAICHEVGHVMYEHAARQRGRDHETWNSAGDYVINSVLQENIEAQEVRGNSFMSLGRGWFYNPKYKGKYTEEVYDDLIRSGNKSKAFDSIIQCEFKDDKDREHFQETWKRRIVASAQAAKMHGKLPLGVEEIIDGLVEPKVDWKAVLRNFVMSSAKSDYKWVPPSRRHQKIVLPSMKTEETTIAFCVDTSGSMSFETLQIVVSELHGIMQQFPGMKILVVQCDSVVHSVELLESLPDAKFKIRGRGCTDFRPAFDAVQQAIDDGVQVQACVFATDGLGDFPDNEPDFPVLWARTVRTDFPFGEVVEVEN